MKSVLLSIKPKYCELIASGKKTVEVRKTRPKIDTPFKCYIYCTKAKEFFSIGGGVYAVADDLYKLPIGKIKFGDSFELAADFVGQYDENNFLNGKVIGEFVCDWITALKADNLIQAYYNNTKETCLDDIEIVLYADGKKLYYMHISDLVIYDKPRMLSEFGLTRPPQSWCYVESEG